MSTAVFPEPYSLQFAYNSQNSQFLTVTNPAQRNVTEPAYSSAGHTLKTGAYLWQLIWNGPDPLRMDIRIGGAVWSTGIAAFEESTNPAPRLRTGSWTIPYGRENLIRLYVSKGYTALNETRGFNASLMIIPMAGFQAGGGSLRSILGSARRMVGRWWR